MMMNYLRQNFRFLLGVVLYFFIFQLSLLKAYELTNSPHEDTEYLSPPLQRLMDKVMLVHVGALCFDEEKSQVCVKGYAPLTYWSMNAPVPNEQFLRKHGHSNCIVLTPLKKRIDSLVSVCAQEVMHLGDCFLGNGDIILFRKSGWIDTYNQRIEVLFKSAFEDLKENHEKDKAAKASYKEEFIKSYPAEDRQQMIEFYDQTIILPLQKYYATKVERLRNDYNALKMTSAFNEEGQRILYSVEERDLLTRIGVEIITEIPDYTYNTLEIVNIENVNQVVKNVLESKGYWAFQDNDEFWTHNTPFMVDGRRISNQKQFFHALQESYPFISLGYEFYSQNGYASLFRVITELDDKEDFYILHPELFITLFNFLKESLIRYLEESPFDSDRKSQSINKIQCITYNVEGDQETQFTEEEKSPLSKPLDSLILEVLLPMSPEVFNGFDKFFANKGLLSELWPYLKEAYEFTEHHRQFPPAHFRAK